MKKFLNIINTYVNNVASFIPQAVFDLTMRLSIFFVFWNAAQSKLAGGTILGQKLQFWNVSESTVMLFDFEYGLPLIPADVAAYLATFGEFFLALGLLFGFLTRLSAFGLFIMTAVIQIFVYPEIWQEHLIWGAILLYIMRNGAGKFSLDYVLLKK